MLNIYPLRIFTLGVQIQAYLLRAILTKHQTRFCCSFCVIYFQISVPSNYDIFHLACFFKRFNRGISSKAYVRHGKGGVIIFLSTNCALEVNYENTYKYLLISKCGLMIKHANQGWFPVSIDLQCFQGRWTNELNDTATAEVKVL